jgi:glycerol-3-phosphate dehydrogenase subunit B
MANEKIVVIGSGLAGTAAAATIRSRGGAVTLMSMGSGATAFASGALDLAGDVEAAPHRPETSRRDTAGLIERLLLHRPGHPYGLIAGSGAAILARIAEAVELLFPAGSPAALAGELGSNQPVFTNLGTIKLTALFPPGTASPGLPGMDRPLVVGLRGLLDFAPSAWAKVARDNATRLGHELDPLIACVSFAGGREAQTPELSAAIARDPGAFIAAIKSAVAGSAAGAVVLAPVLPGAGRAELMAELSRAVDRPVYETISLPPSVPGLRLIHALEARVRELGVEVERGEVMGFEREGGKISALRVRVNGDERRVGVKAVVLAAGKFLGGGLEKTGAFHEKLFGLPVVSGGAEPGEVFIEKLLGARVTGPHPVFAAGLRVNSRFQPASADGEPVWANLLAAGAIIAGADYIADGCGAGVALATGAQAGINALEFSSR